MSLRLFGSISMAAALATVGCAKNDSDADDASMRADAGAGATDAASGGDATSGEDASGDDADVEIDATAGDASANDAASSGDASSMDASARDGATSDASADASADAGTMTVPVYYAMDSDGSLRLYREFHRVAVGPSAVEAAIEQMLHAPAFDPDYDSLWPEATALLGVEISGASATVDVSADALAGGGSAAEQIALQQLVYTVTAANNTITSVTLKIEGASIDTLWGHVDASGPMTRAPRLDVLGFVWIIDPQHGDQRSTLTVQGDATVFEGTVLWSVERACMAPPCTESPFMLTGHATASEGAPGRGTWSTGAISLPDAAYEAGGLVRITAWESSAKDGSARRIDDKVITLVR